MFDIGLGEIGVIALVALLVLGPAEFIAVARKAGQFVGQLKRMAGNWQAELHKLESDVSDRHAGGSQHPSASDVDPGVRQGDGEKK